MGDMACARQTTARMPGHADPFAPVLLALAVIVLAAALGRRAAGLLGAPATLMLEVMLWPSPAFAGETIEQIKSRRSLRCGVSEGVVGFSVKEPSGRWSGLDADFCRAVAAAALGDPEKVTFVPLRASARFPALQLGGIDLLARNTTWTLSREAGLKVVFAGVSFYDAQAFMVPAASSVKSPAQLKGATVCVEKGTTNERNLVDYFAARSLSITPLVIDSTIEVAEAFFGGRCAAYTADAAHLAAARLRAPEGRAFRILPERISKEPLAPAVRSGDDDWLTLVRWVLFALIAADALTGATHERHPDLLDARRVRRGDPGHRLRRDRHGGRDAAGVERADRDGRPERARHRRRHEDGRSAARAAVRRHGRGTHACQHGHLRPRGRALSARDAGQRQALPAAPRRPGRAPVRLSAERHHGDSARADHHQGRRRARGGFRSPDGAHGHRE